MARHVSGSDLALLDAVRQQKVPRPEMMQWNAFQVWHSREGKRPTMAVDGCATTNAKESILWKTLMNQLYGPEWTLELASAEEAQPSTQSSERRLVPAADAESLEDRHPISPGSGLDGSPVAEGLMPDRGEDPPQIADSRPRS